MQLQDHTLHYSASRGKKQPKNCLNELTDGEMWIFKGMAFQICGAA